jgi:hypothetical protein
MHQRRCRTASAFLAIAAAAVGLAPAAQAREAPSAESHPATPVPVVRVPSGFAVSQPVRLLPRAPVGNGAAPSLAPRLLVDRSAQGIAAKDPAAQSALGSGTAPIQGVSFDGIASRSDQQLVPPDPNGEVGPNDFVELINLQMAVYSKTGHLRFGPVTLQDIFAPLGKQCGVSGVGDPIVVYDQLADRWLLSQLGFLFDPFSGEPTGPYFECVAVSKTGDPAGQYFLYAFKISDRLLNDYPKLGVWPDAYYLSINQFAEPDFDFAGGGAIALDRARMLAGDPDAPMVYFNLFNRDPNLGGLLPADLDGHRLPPAGTPGLFAQVSDPTEEVLADSHEGEGEEGGEGGGEPGEDRQVHSVSVDSIQLFRFHVDWDHPASSRFDGPTNLATAPFDENMCDFDNECIPQKGTFAKLDPLSDRLMFRAAYRNFGDHQALVLNHTVDVGVDHAGVRWYEIRNPAGNATLFQQGTFAPDEDNRWMGSAAMDANGDIALGYSVSGQDLFPSVRYTARRAGDPLGQMTLGEGSLVEGSGAQTAAGPFARWGDYSDLTVDSVDDCTFWYTQEYYKATSEIGFATRIGSFAVPGCDGIAPTAKARNVTARAGRQVKLRYETADNSGQTHDEITIFRPNGRKLKSIETPLHDAGTFAVTIKAPPAGSYTWQVVAIDAKGNASDASRRRLRTTR